MADIRIVKAHGLSQSEARGKMASFEQLLADKYKMKTSWKGNRADLKGPSVSGFIDVGTQDVTIEVSLGLLARAVVDPKRAEASIRKRLDAAFGA
jgi:putative polyhydroxyalkanoate system protein